MRARRPHLARGCLSKLTKNGAMHFSAWLYVRQGGRCFLMTTEACQRVDGFIEPIQLGKGEAGIRKGRGWTWEHVIPRSAGGVLRLLACKDCNQAKGAKPPSMRHIEQALALALEWHNSRGELEQADRAVECARWYAATIGAKNPPAPAPPKPPLAEEDWPVPRTVEEALAQGGIVVRR